MSTVAQVDRSDLEKMEKDRLLAIGKELQLKVSTRNKKADIIDMIMSAALGPQSKTDGDSSREALGGGENGSDGPSKRSRRSSTNGKSEQMELEQGAMPVAPSSARADESQSGSSAGSLPLFPPITVVPKTKSKVTEKPAVEVEPKMESVDSLPPSPTEVQTASQETTSKDNSQSPSPGEAVSRPEGDGGSRRSRRRRGRDGSRGQDRGETTQAEQAIPVELTDVAGVLDLRDEGFGFIRANGYLPSPKDIYVSAAIVRRYGLRKGDYLVGGARPANANEKYSAIVRVDQVSGTDPEESKSRPRFEDLTPLFPDENLRLESKPGEVSKDFVGNLTARIIDLISPIGKGQRGLIVSPPKAGKTTIMKQLAHAIETNNPEVHLMFLLVDERPEEVTDIRRSVQGEVVASTFDRPAEEHTVVAELAIERAKRMVEKGRDVVIMLDGITRLARAYNLAQPATGRIMSGGVDSGALYPPKKFFGAARNVEEGGSLTILATALVETGSKMDEVIFEEFKGTGNMELKLDRRLAERRLYPAIDVNASSTRHEELLFTREELNLVWKLRRVMNALAAEGSSAPALELLIDKIKSTRSNAEFLAEIQKSPVG
jgi:transcription termination factor Rho